MNKRRFNEFKSDLKEAFGLIIQQYPDANDFVTNVGRNLGSKYPELVDGEQQEPLQTRDEQKYEKVSKELSLNLNLTRNKDYQGIENNLKRNNLEECIESVNLLSRTIGDSRKKIVYYSSLQGELLKRVKEVTTPYSFTLLLSLTQISKSYAYFLIKLSDLVQQYQKLMYCELPIRYFNENFNAIKQVCEKDPSKWQ